MRAVCCMLLQKHMHLILEPTFCGICGPMRKVGIKAHDWSKVHFESHVISRETKVKQNAPIIHLFRNTIKGFVIIVIITMDADKYSHPNAK
jgi:hypothetical protein